MNIKIVSGNKKNYVKVMSLIDFKVTTHGH